MRRLPLVLSSLALLAALPAQDPKPANASATASTIVAMPARDDAAAERLGWRLSVQAWTFRDRTAFEAIDTAHALGLKYIELYPGQKLAPEHGDSKVDVAMADDLRKALQDKLKKADVKVVNFGVVSMSKDEAKTQKLFDFAKAMGIETLTCEPDADAWDVVEKLCEQYSINAACHDHPKPSHYWNPETVLACVGKRSPRCGACADTGHWVRSGLDPVRSLQLLRGRVITLHFKDIAPADATGEDQPWGTGKGNARGQLEELQRQGFRGAISIEYETGEGKLLEENVRKCIAWFDATAKELAGKPAQKQ